MRTYAPASAIDVLERLLDEPSLARGVVHHEVRPAIEARYGEWPAWLDPRLRAGLAKRGIERPYIHQADAIEAVHAGEDVVVVTPTASGKSLCYMAPVLQSLAEDPSARALFLFPTKALGQDQVAELSELVRDAGLEVSSAAYDGDTPAPIRSAIRKAGQVVVTNPDMLHSAILPHHTKWFQLFEQLRVIVIDELHMYRGVFGSHVANVLRRLLRLCAHYGSHPVIVCCSATIGNPSELAEMLVGRPVRTIDRNGAPAGEKHLLLVDPPVIDGSTGARGSALTLAERWALPFLRAGRQTVVFGRSRVSVEIMLSNMREALRTDLGPRSRIRGYRAGYLPTERRSIERGLRDGEVLGVVSTNALELGVDIGRARRGGARRLPGLDRRDVAADGPRRAAGRRQRRDPRRVARARRPVRHPPPGVPARAASRRRRGSTPTTSTCCSPTCARAAFELPFEPGDCVRSRAGGRAARVPGRGRPGPPGRRRALVLELGELPRLGDLAPVGGARERRDHRHVARPAARAGRGRPVRRAGPRPRARDLHARVGRSTTSTGSSGASARRTSTGSTPTTTRTRTGR